MMKQKLAIFIASWLISLSCIAQTYTNNQLNIGVGAQAYAMGNAVVATIDNTTAGYWNPAGLANMGEGIQPAIMHAELFAGISKFDYLSVAMGLAGGSSVVGLSIFRNGVDGIPNTLFAVDGNGIFRPEQVTYFSSSDYGMIFSFAKPNLLIDNLNVGINAKVYYRTAGDFTNAYGFGIDIGGQYTLGDVKFGLMLKDITTTVLAWSFNFTEEEKQVFAATGNDIPVKSTEFSYPKINLGAAYNFEFTDKLSLLAELDLDMTTDGKRNVLIGNIIDPHFGLEFNYNDLVFLRGGLNNMQKGTSFAGKEVTFIQPNLGAGIKVADLHIDYALTRFGDSNQSVFSHIFSLMFDINRENTSNNF